jgi:hypothetical protein
MSRRCPSKYAQQNRAFFAPRPPINKLYDKVGALEKLGRHLGIKEKVEVAGAGGGPVQIDMPVPELMRRLAFLLTKPKGAA